MFWVDAAEELWNINKGPNYDSEVQPLCGEDFLCWINYEATFYLLILLNLFMSQLPSILWALICRSKRERFSLANCEVMLEISILLIYIKLFQRHSLVRVTALDAVSVQVEHDKPVILNVTLLPTFHGLRLHIFSLNGAVWFTTLALDVLSFGHSTVSAHSIKRIKLKDRGRDVVASVRRSTERCWWYQRTWT